MGVWKLLGAVLRCLLSTLLSAAQNRTETYTMSNTIPNVPFTHLSAGELCKVRIHTFLPEQEMSCTEESVETFLGDDFRLEPLSKKGCFRWIHLPVNNMVWAEVRTLMSKAIE